MSNPFAVSDGLERSVVTGSTLKVKRVGVVSLGLFFAAGAFVTSAVVCAFLFVIIVMGFGNGRWQPAEMAGLIFLPIMYGILGFIVGAFYAIVYNVIASMTGGIELEIESK